MILTKLKLHNFGVYAGHQIFDLSPDEENNSVTLIGALNGSGKTTFLTAIQLVLYGPRAPRTKSNKVSYKEYLRGKINRAAPAEEGASIQLEFSMFDDEGERRYSVQRFWKGHRNGKVDEELLVLVDDEANKFLTQNWAEHIETLLPARIMPLFFFDGEKIEELATAENTSEILSSAVKGLLGLDLVDQLTTDLGVFEQRKTKSIASQDELLEIEGSQQAQKALEVEWGELSEKRVELDKEREQQQKALGDAIAEYAAKGGELFEKREEFKSKREHAISQFSNHAEEMAKVALASAPLLLVRELLDEVTIQSELEDVSEKAEAVLELIDAHDRKTVRKLSELAVDATSIEELTTYLASERKSHEESANQERYINLSKSGREQLHDLNKSTLGNVTNEIIEGLEINAALIDEIDQLEKLLLAVPEDEIIEPLRHEVENKERLIVNLDAEIQIIDRRIHETKTKIEAEGRQLRLQMAKSVDATLESEDAKRALVHSEKVRSTLGRFGQMVLQRKLRKLEESILECFGELTRKSNLITHLTIDPERFEMRLKGEDGDEIVPSDLSAGERQLLATSVLWGLSRASQRQIPAIIDTPLGRLDSGHREMLCERYFPKASHQVILLSTDEEVDERYLEILKPSINKTYQVAFDPQNGGSAVLEGYLF
jgi:DNA sulfur modification protein DndD